MVVKTIGIEVINSYQRGSANKYLGSSSDDP